MKYIDEVIPMSNYERTADIHEIDSDSDSRNIINLEYKDEYSRKNKTLVCIVIPTYNEVNNILKLLISVYSKDRQRRYSEKNIIMTVLVVDDNSPDGTGEVVKTYRRKNPNVYLLSRKDKDGLGAAYMAGMQHSMKLLRPDIIFEMDGDLSHDPEYILPMVIKIREGADLVIGSRYVKGGSIPENWGIKRKLISRIANLYAKVVLGIKDVSDCTGGFRAIRTSALEQIDFTALKTKGYAFQISLLEEMRRNNAIMREVPIAFRDRTSGKSKMRLGDIIEEGLFVLRAGWQNAFAGLRTPAAIKDMYDLGLSENSRYMLEARNNARSNTRPNAHQVDADIEMDIGGILHTDRIAKDNYDAHEASGKGNDHGYQTRLDA